MPIYLLTNAPKRAIVQATRAESPIKERSLKMNKKFIASAAGMIVLVSSLTGCDVVADTVGVASTAAQKPSITANGDRGCNPEISIARSRSGSAVEPVLAGTKNVDFLTFEVTARKCAATLNAIGTVGYGVRNAQVLLSSDGRSLGRILEALGSKPAMTEIGLKIPAGETRTLRVVGDIDPTADYSAGIAIAVFDFEGRATMGELRGNLMSSFKIAQKERILGVEMKFVNRCDQKAAAVTPVVTTSVTPTFIDNDTFDKDGKISAYGREWGGPDGIPISAGKTMFGLTGGVALVRGENYTKVIHVGFADGAVEEAKIPFTVPTGCDKE